jgi:hypothetical protein
MAQYNWLPATGGFWQTGTAWDQGVVPSSNDSATIAVAGTSPYTVTLNLPTGGKGTTLTVGSLDIDSANAQVVYSNTTLTFNLGGLTIENGSFSIAANAKNALTDSGNLGISGGQFIESTGTATTTGVTLSGGKVAISGGTFADSGAFSISTGTVANSFTVSNTGVATLTDGIASTSSGILNVSSGGSLVFGTGSVSSNGLAAGTVTFSGGADGAFFAPTGSATIGTAFKSFQDTDVLGFVGSITKDTYASGKLTVTTTSGTYTFNSFGLGDPSGTFLTGGTETVGGTKYYTLELVCFVAGTRIRTEHGEVAVEDIAAGDRVVTLEDGAEVLRAVSWVGNRRLAIAAHARPEMAAPVRIRAGAFGEDLPQRDLLLSPDHCLFVDGKLVPAKLLVNDMTIVNERTMNAVTYYHVELERHAVLLAEGLPAESYLDTGNRAFFPDSGLPTVLHPEFHVNAGHRCWDDACAPLASDPAEVEALWHRLAARAEALGHKRPVVQTTTDADLHVMADGKTIRPVSVSAGHHVFVLPAGASSIRLASRFALPSDLAPCADDRRRLGVAISRITVRADASHIEIPADHPRLTRGWHNVEHDGQAQWRWTDGDALLPLSTSSGAATLEVQVRTTGTYILNGTGQPNQLAA